MCSIQHFLQSSSSCVIDVTHKPNTLINNQNFIHMTKHLRYLFAVLLVWVCTVGGYAGTKSVVCTVGGSTCTSEGLDIAWIFSQSASKDASGRGYGWSKPSGVTLTATLPSEVTVTSVVVNANTNASGTTSTSIDVSVGNVSYGTKTIAKGSTNLAGNSDYTYEGTTKSNTVKLSVTSGKSCWIYTITINYEESGSSSLTPTTTSFGTDKDGSTVALTEGLLSDGSDFTGYTATESTGAAGTISYAATGDGVATVDATTGALTINKTTYGTTTITATFTPTDTETYATSTAKYTITNEKKVDESTIVFDCESYSQTIVGTYKNNTGTERQFPSVAGKNYTFTLTSCMYNNQSVQMQANNGKIVSPVFTSFPNGYKVVVTYDQTAPTLTSTELTDAKSVSNESAKTLTLELPSPATFTIKASSNYAQIKRIELTALTPKTDPAFSFANPTEEVELKEGFADIQAITKPADLDDKAITYVSSDNTIAEVTEGLITLKKTGEVTIKATSAATDNYAAGSAEYTLKVVDTRADAQISVKEESVDVELSTENYNPADNINNPNNVKLTYASSNADITINAETGKLAFTKVGSTTVTVSFAGDNSYKPFETSFTLNVVDTRATEAPISIKEQTVTVQLPTDEYYASTNVTNDQKLTLTYAIDNKDFEIDETSGFVAFDKVGSATITVSFAGDKTYKSFTGTFTLNVEESRTTDVAFKFDAESYTLDLADGKAEFDANAKLQNPNNLTYTWEISPMTNGESIDASGKATGLKRGTYTITATSTTNKNYLATTATCQLVVENSAVENETVEFVAGTEKGTQSEYKADNEDKIIKSFVTIHATNAALAAKTQNVYTYRLYKSSNTTISTKIGNITKIEFKGSENTAKNNSLSNLSTEDERYSTTSPNYGVWTGSAKEVVFTASAQARATNIIVTLELPVAKSYTLDEATTDNVIENYENANVTLKRTLEASHWNTFCVPFALDADEVKQYFGEGTELRTYEGNCADNVVNFTVVDNIEAGKPYIMKPGTAVVTDPEFKNVIMVADDLDADGNPQAVGATTSVQMKGIYNHVTLEQNETNLYIGAGNKFYYPADADACEMNGLRAYFIVPEGTDIKKLRANLDGTATSLDDIFGTEETGAAVYNLQGLYVGNSLKQLKSGVYIQNGKKIVVK